MFHLPIVELVVGLVVAVLAAGGLLALAALMTVESFGFPPLPSEVILLFAGVLVADGAYSGEAAFAAALLGGVAGSFLAFYLGERVRAWLFPAGRPPRLPVREEHLAAMDRWFARHGEGTVAVARLLPVVRAYISYPAGAAGMRPVRFGLFTAVGAAPFTAAFLYAGYVLGSDWSSIVPYFTLLDDAALAIVALLLLYLLLRWFDVIGPGAAARRARRDRTGGGA